MQAWTCQRCFTASQIEGVFHTLEHSNLFHETGPFSRFYRKRMTSSRGTRAHVEIPLAEVTRLQPHMPSELWHVYTQLHHLAQTHVQARLAACALAPAHVAELTDSLARKSVLRLLRYDAQVGCRPHVDPGLCTALLLGSAGGLEVNTRDDVAVAGAGQMGNYRYEGDTDAPSPLDLLPHWEAVVPSSAAVETDCVVMNSNFLSVLSKGQQRGVLHRVRADWGGNNNISNTNNSKTAPSPLARYNVVVELRPGNPKVWYRRAQA